MKKLKMPRYLLLAAMLLTSCGPEDLLSLPISGITSPSDQTSGTQDSTSKPDPTTPVPPTSEVIVPPTSDTSVPPLPDPDGDYLTVAELVKKPVGTKLKTRATLSGVKGNGYYIEDETGAFFIYNGKGSYTYKVGDVLDIEGEMGEFASAGIKQIINPVYNKVEERSLNTPVTISSFDQMEENMNKRALLNGVVVKSITISPTNDTKMMTTFQGQDLLFFVYKSCPNKKAIEAVLETLKVGDSLNLSGAIVDKFKGSYQMCLLNENELVVKDLTDVEKMKIVMGSLKTIFDMNGTTITYGVNLPLTGSFSSSMTWTSSDEAHFSSQGVVTRPEFETPNAPIKLTYKVTMGALVESGEINFTVLAKSKVNGNYEFTYVQPSSQYNAEYYSRIGDDLRGDALISALNTLLDDDEKDGEKFSYKGLFECFKYSDADPKNPNSGKILSFYSGTPSDRGAMNREHTWPNSRGGDKLESDPHMTRPTLTSENSARGNAFFNENGSWDPASFGNPKYRGIAARVIMYGAVKASEFGHRLVDLSNDTASDSNPTMGKLSDLLKWNLEFEIDDSELLRNDVIENKFKRNPNPFIEDRNYGCKIWGATNAKTRSICGIK